ncbi:MAG: hypothetical protein KJ558_09240 [Gammaproteobacteria bacterium]|nr:hypothetical protein [Gammaproteobacteria bacterium]MBU1654992.1 hypothetical protein [Gammaproteobacteria bacterium]MBU1960013.1 hypothetical protein [Gammaproteobacteria bacterium]
MDSAIPAGGRCAWISGDLARFERDRDAQGGLGEVGYCNRLGSDTLMAGIGLGKSASDEDRVFSRVSGSFFLHAKRKT